MEKIEVVTCIKFEDRNKNYHKERVIEMVDRSPWTVLHESLHGFEWFLNITSNKDYIKFIKGFDCHSVAGREGGGQHIVLTSYCAEEHTLIHEVYFAIKRVFE